jgi:hypothetical protein
MRHVLLLGAIATRTHRMAQATAAARLIALAGGALAVVPGLLRAAAATVDLAAIAAAADEHLSLAADTEEQPAGRLVGAQPRTGVDDVRNGWNTGPACVLGTVWGTASIPDLPV